MNCALDDVKDEEGISDHRYSHYKKPSVSVELREENEDVRISKIGTEESSCRAQSKAVEDGALFWWVSCPEHGRENLCKHLRRDPQPPSARVCEGIQAMCCEVWGNLARLDNHWWGGGGYKPVMPAGRGGMWCVHREQTRRCQCPLPHPSPLPSPVPSIDKAPKKYPSRDVSLRVKSQDSL